MTTHQLISQVARLVGERETIDHGSIRCLWSQEAVDSIQSVDDCDEVGTGTVGDDDLAATLTEVVDDPERLMFADASGLADALSSLYDAHKGESIDDYLDRDAEDELGALDNLIEAARKLAEEVLS